MIGVFLGIMINLKKTLEDLTKKDINNKTLMEIKLEQALKDTLLEEENAIYQTK